ncbi:MAG: hypothetical protein ABIT04_12650 [Novosphingobium sp.]
MMGADKLVVAGMLALAVAGCTNREAAEGNKAVSEVLPGSASDAMIPYDTLRSQPPLAPAAQGSDTARDESGGKARRGATLEPTADASAAASGAAPRRPHMRAWALRDRVPPPARHPEGRRSSERGRPLLRARATLTYSAFS